MAESKLKGFGREQGEMAGCLFLWIKIVWCKLFDVIVYIFVLL